MAPNGPSASRMQRPLQSDPAPPVGSQDYDATRARRHGVRYLSVAYARRGPGHCFAISLFTDRAGGGYPREDRPPRCQTADSPARELSDRDQAMLRSAGPAGPLQG